MYYESTINPIRNEQGELEGVYMSGHDVSEMVNSYHRQQNSVRQLQKANDNIRQYIANIDYALSVSGVQLVNYYPHSYTFELINRETRQKLRMSQLRCIRLASPRFRRTVNSALNRMDHLTKRGIIQAIGVFLDTMVICTLTGFVLIMGQAWMGNGSAAWMELGRLEKFLASCAQLLDSGTGYGLATLVISICFGIFAFTCLLGFLSFSEICARQISIASVRLVNLTVLAFGMVTNIAGFDLSALWNLSDFANIVMVCCNLPLLYLGFGQVKKAFANFEDQNEEFNSETFGTPVPVWDECTASSALHVIKDAQS